MTTPRMIRADGPRTRAGRLERAAKIGNGELRHAVAVTLGHHLVIKSSHGLAELRQQITLTSGAIGNSRISRGLVGVGIESAERSKKYLTLKAQRVFDLDQLGNLSQLVTQTRRGKRCRQ